MKSGIRTRTLLLLGSVALLTACSAIKLGYNNSATIAHTYLTSKVGFDSEQSARLKTSLNGLVQWHRLNELPGLAKELETARNALHVPNGETRPIEARQVQILNESIRASLRRTADHAAPVIARNMLGLWPNQIADIQNALNESNKKYRDERITASEKERQKRSVERMAERFERWLGNLDQAQLARIEQWAETDVSKPEERYKKRLERQQQFMGLVEQAANRQITQAQLGEKISTLLNGWQTPSGSAEKALFAARQKAAVELVVDVLNMANATQRNNAADRAAGWAEDFLILASSD